MSNLIGYGSYDGYSGNSGCGCSSIGGCSGTGSCGCSGHSGIGAMGFFSDCMRSCDEQHSSLYMSAEDEAALIACRRACGQQHPPVTQPPVPAKSDKIAGLTPFAWVMVAAGAGVLAYLIGQRD